MRDIKIRLAERDWESITKELHDQGFVTVKNLLTRAECQELINNYHSPDAYRKTIVMERYRFGLGEYKYFKYPLPALVSTLRESIYPLLVPIANQWMQEAGVDKQFPGTLQQMTKQCHDKGQVYPTPLILHYQKNGFNALHQDLYGEVYFPIQLLFVLSQPVENYTGGEFVITEQIPRAQSKANVLNPNQGDMVIFTTNFRPVKGSKGFYKVNMKHGVSPVHAGERYSMGIIFHDAQS